MEPKYILAMPCVEAIDFALTNCNSHADEEKAMADLTHLFQNRYPDCEVIFSVCDITEIGKAMKRMRKAIRESAANI